MGLRELLNPLRLQKEADELRIPINGRLLEGTE
jgi:hypothetical protein